MSETERLSSHIMSRVTVAEAVASDAAYYDSIGQILGNLIELLHKRGVLSTEDVLVILSPNWTVE